MKQFIEFERTARFDTEAYAAKAETTAGVFSRLGIPLPVAATAVVAPTAGGLMAVLSKYSQGLIGAFIATLITAGVMYFALDGNRNSTEVINNSVISQKTYKVNKGNNSLANSNVPIMKSGEGTEPRVVEKIVVKYMDRPVYIEQEKDVLSESVEEKTIDNNEVS